MFDLNKFFNPQSSIKSYIASSVGCSQVRQGRISGLKSIFESEKTFKPKKKISTEFLPEL